MNVCDRSRLVLPSRAYLRIEHVCCVLSTQFVVILLVVFGEGCVDDGNGDVELTAGGLPKRNFFFFFPPPLKKYTPVNLLSVRVHVFDAVLRVLYETKGVFPVWPVLFVGFVYTYGWVGIGCVQFGVETGLFVAAHTHFFSIESRLK